MTNTSKLLRKRQPVNYKAPSLSGMLSGNISKTSVSKNTKSKPVIPRRRDKVVTEDGRVFYPCPYCSRAFVESSRRAHHVNSCSAKSYILSVGEGSKLKDVTKATGKTQQCNGNSSQGFSGIRESDLSRTADSFETSLINERKAAFSVSTVTSKVSQLNSSLPKVTTLSNVNLAVKQPIKSVEDASNQPVSAILQPIVDSNNIELDNERLSQKFAKDLKVLNKNCESHVCPKNHVAQNKIAQNVTKTKAATLKSPVKKAVDKKVTNQESVICNNIFSNVTSHNASQNVMVNRLENSYQPRETLQNNLNIKQKELTTNSKTFTLHTNPKSNKITSKVKSVHKAVKTNPNRHITRKAAATSPIHTIDNSASIVEVSPKKKKTATLNKNMPKKKLRKVASISNNENFGVLANVEEKIVDPVDKSALKNSEKIIKKNEILINNKVKNVSKKTNKKSKSNAKRAKTELDEAAPTAVDSIAPNPPLKMIIRKSYTVSTCQNDINKAAVNIDVKQVIKQKSNQTALKKNSLSEIAINTGVKTTPNNTISADKYRGKVTKPKTNKSKQQKVRKQIIATLFKNNDGINNNEAIKEIYSLVNSINNDIKSVGLISINDLLETKALSGTSKKKGAKQKISKSNSKKVTVKKQAKPKVQNPQNKNKNVSKKPPQVGTQKGKSGKDNKETIGQEKSMGISTTLKSKMDEDKFARLNVYCKSPKDADISRKKDASDIVKNIPINPPKSSFIINTGLPNNTSNQYDATNGTSLITPPQVPKSVGNKTTSSSVTVQSGEISSSSNIHFPPTNVRKQNDGKDDIPKVARPQISKLAGNKSANNDVTPQSGLINSSSNASINRKELENAFNQKDDVFEEEEESEQEDDPVVNVNQKTPDVTDKPQNPLTIPCTCPFCQVVYPNALELLRHKRVAHKFPKIYVSLKQVEKYYDTEDKSHCPICKKPIKLRDTYPSQNKWVFIKHLKTHTAEVSYRCSKCNRNFRRLDHMKDHEKRHF